MLSSCTWRRVGDTPASEVGTVAQVWLVGAFQSPDRSHCCVWNLARPAQWHQLWGPEALFLTSSKLRAAVWAGAADESSGEELRALKLGGREEAKGRIPSLTDFPHLQDEITARNTRGRGPAPSSPGASQRFLKGPERQHARIRGHAVGYSHSAQLSLREWPWADESSALITLCLQEWGGPGRWLVPPNLRSDEGTRALL